MDILFRKVAQTSCLRHCSAKPKIPHPLTAAAINAAVKLRITAALLAGAATRCTKLHKPIRKKTPRKNKKNKITDKKEKG